MEELNLPAEPEIPQQEAPAAEPETTPEHVAETIPFKVRGEERQLPADAVRALAESLGYDDPQAVVNQLQMAKDASEVYRQARELYKRSRVPQQPEEQYQPQQREPQRPQYQPPAYQPVPQAEEDPVALVKAIYQQTQQLAQQQAQMFEATQAQLQASQYQRQREEARLIREAQTTYQEFAQELQKKGTPEHRVPDMEYLLEEAESMGLFNSDLPVSEIYRRTYRMLYADDLAQQAASEATRKLRDPKTTVVIPGAKASAPAPPPPANTIAGMEAQLGGLTMADIIDSLPKAR